MRRIIVLALILCACSSHPQALPTVAVLPTAIPITPTFTFAPTQIPTNPPIPNATETAQSQILLAQSTSLAATNVAMEIAIRQTQTAMVRPTSTDVPQATKVVTNNRNRGNIHNQNELVAQWLNCNLPGTSRDVDLISHKVAEAAYLNDWATVGTTMVIYSSNCSVDTAFQIAWYLVFVDRDGDHLLPYAADWNIALSDFKNGWYR